ncbi:MAG: hypothetical protein GF331_20530 [Chitinivibrionales bacterium]|nr:hypothetical protein [Chitinivibrionales bacterium]
MRKLRAALTVLFGVSTVVSSVWADSTSIEFFDPTGTTITGKVGWKGDAATGEMFIETPNDGNGVSIKEGNVTANSFTGDGSGLTNLPASTVDWTDIQNRPAGLDDGDQAGISSESDPTVPANVKDGIEWSEVSNKPSSYTPSSHSHGWTEIDNKPIAFEPTTHTHSYGDVTDKPSTFDPSPHDHSISDVSALQGTLDGKASLSGATFSGGVTFGGDIFVGSGGTALRSIRVVTGTIVSSGSATSKTTLNLPSGFTQDNCFVLSAVAAYGPNTPKPMYCLPDPFETATSVRLVGSTVEVIASQNLHGNVVKILLLRYM